MTWKSDLPPDKARIGPAGWLRVAVKGGVLVGVVFGGLALHLVAGAVERLSGRSRPVTPRITQGVCITALRVLGVRLAVEGRPEGAAFVANHASWLDIFVLNASHRVTFVAKSEVSGWAGIGWLARATGTVFIRRDRREAAEQNRILAERIAAGDRLMLFPEGTSTDGLRVLPFKPTLFAAFFNHSDKPVQPVSLRYHPPPGAEPRFYGWWGQMDFAPHLAKVLAGPSGGRVTVAFLPPLRPAEVPDRKTLAALAEEAVRKSFEAKVS